MNMIFKLMFFTIFLNMSIGILHVVIPQADTIAVQNQDSQILKWEQDINESNNQLTALTQQNGLFSFLGLGDFAILRMVTSFLTHIYDFAFGFVKILDTWFGSQLKEANGDLYTILFGFLNTFTTIAYFMGLFFLFTGKRVDDYG